MRGVGWGSVCKQVGGRMDGDVVLPDRVTVKAILSSFMTMTVGGVKTISYSFLTRANSFTYLIR